MAWSQFKLEWTAAPDSQRQIVYWRIKGETEWHSEGFTPANPLEGSDEETILYDHDDEDLIKENTIYEFKIASYCRTDLSMENFGGVVEKISLYDIFDDDYGVTEEAITDITRTSANVYFNFGVKPFIYQIRMEVHKVSDHSSVLDVTHHVAQYESPGVTNSEQKFALTGLAPNTNYYIQMEFIAIINGNQIVKSTDAGQLSDGDMFNQGNLGSDFDLNFTTLT